MFAMVAIEDSFVAEAQQWLDAYCEKESSHSLAKKNHVFLTASFSSFPTPSSHLALFTSRNERKASERGSHHRR
jgi:hypothetical protein